MKKYLFPFSIMVLSIIISLIVGIQNNNNLITLSSSILGVINVTLLTIGHWCSYIFGILVTILYPIVCFQNGLYGEVILYIFFLLPIRLYGIVTWIKNHNKEMASVQVNHITRKETGLMISISLVMFVGFYFLLKILDTKQLIFSTLSVVINILAAYLLARRFSFAFIFYLILDVVLLVLWGTPVLKGEFGGVAQLCSVTSWFIIDSYGLINWTKMNEKQKIK